MVGTAVFSETPLRIFLIFCTKLGDYKCRKVTELDFWKKTPLNWRYSGKGIQISPKSENLIFFSKTAWTIFLVFGLKLELNMTFNLNETYFSVIFQKIAQIEVFGHFLDFASLVFLDFAHNDRWAWCLAVFLQFAGPVNVFLLDTKPQFIESWKLIKNWFYSLTRHIENIGIVIESHCMNYKKLYLNRESAKSRALRVYMLACLACLRAYVLACVRACLLWWNVLFSYVFAYLVCFFVLFALHFNT